MCFVFLSISYVSYTIQFVIRLLCFLYKVFLSYSIRDLKVVFFPYIKSFLDCHVFSLSNLFLEFFVQTFILLKSIFGIRTDMNDRPHTNHGKINDVSIFQLPDLLQQKNINSEVCSDWLNWCIRPSDWLVKI